MHSPTKSVIHSAGAPTLEDIFAIQAAVATLPTASVVLTHHFSDGVYARELFIPKYSFVVGKMHRRTHLVIISKGAISIWTTNGEEYYQAPCTIVCPAGMKRAVYAHEDTIWTTVHGTTETDLDKIEAEFIFPDEQLKLNLGEAKCLGSPLLVLP